MCDSHQNYSFQKIEEEAFTVYFDWSSRLEQSWYLKDFYSGSDVTDVLDVEDVASVPSESESKSNVRFQPQE